MAIHDATTKAARALVIDLDNSGGHREDVFAGQVLIGQLRVSNFRAWL